MTKATKTKGIKWSVPREMINFQTLFNGIGIILILLISAGLWTCLQELQKLKQSTDSVTATIAMLQHINPLSHQGIHKRDTRRVMKPPLQNTLDRNKRTVSKRAAYPADLNYDPFSTNQKDTEEYCWSLLYKRCGGTVPGVPGQGPPGPPGPPGKKGEVGHQGAMGHMGPPGVNGLKGQKGDQGSTGRVGEPGSDGPRGPPGHPGINGIRGADGRRGKRGASGKPGVRGERGLRGLPGYKGQKGEPGDPVTSMSTVAAENCTCFGVQGWKGQIGPPGPKGERGERGYCSASKCGDKYVRDTETKTELYTVPKVTTTPSTTTTTAIPTTTTVPTTTPTIPPSLAPRTKVCRIKAVGKPTLIKRFQSAFGTWLIDPLYPDQIWITRGFHGNILEEYGSEDKLKRGIIDRTHKLRLDRYYGTQHAMYNRSLYYQFKDKPHIVRYDLVQQGVSQAKVDIDSHFNDETFLYKSSKIYFDITADENGLWVIFGREKRDGSWVHIMKLDLVSMDTLRVWKLPIKTGVYTNGFIACGIVYFVEAINEQVSKIAGWYDLYSTNERFEKAEKSRQLQLHTPFKKNTMMTFYTNMRDRRSSMLLGWDNGFMMKYRLLF